MAPANPKSEEDKISSMTKKEFAELIENIIDQKNYKRVEKIEEDTQKNESKILDIEIERGCLKTQIVELQYQFK